MRYCFVTIYRRNYERRFWKISYIHFRACRGRIACRRYDCGRGVLRGGGGFRQRRGNYTKQEFTFIDKDAEIRNKSILDIYDMVKGGNIKETTVSDAKRIFGIDIIKILENSLEITVDDKSRETLGALKVADVFKDDNLKVVLNCFTLGDVLKRRVSIRPRDLQASRLCRNIFRSPSSTDSTRCLNHWNSTK